jgi:hypothetical protein
MCPDGARGIPEVIARCGPVRSGERFWDPHQHTRPAGSRGKDRCLFAGQLRSALLPRHHSAAVRIETHDHTVLPPPWPRVVRLEGWGAAFFAQYGAITPLAALTGWFCSHQHLGDGCAEDLVQRSDPCTPKQGESRIQCGAPRVALQSQKSDAPHARARFMSPTDTSVSLRARGTRPESAHATRRPSRPMPCGPRQDGRVRGSGRRPNVRRRSACDQTCPQASQFT